MRPGRDRGPDDRGAEHGERPGGIDHRVGPGEGGRQGVRVADVRDPDFEAGAGRGRRQASRVTADEDRVDATPGEFGRR